MSYHELLDRLSLTLLGLGIGFMLGALVSVGDLPRALAGFAAMLIVAIALALNWRAYQLQWKQWAEERQRLLKMVIGAGDTNPGPEPGDHE